MLPEDMFSFELGRSVMSFSCCENNLLELPSSLYKIDVKCLLEADYNPLISPPAYLLSEGLDVIQNYLKIRVSRKV